jgi:hypothetical protein
MRSAGNPATSPAISCACRPPDRIRRRVVTVLGSSPPMRTSNWSADGVAPRKGELSTTAPVMRLDLADQRVHESVRVEDPALGRMQRAHGAQGRFQRQGLRGVQAGHAFHPVRLAARGQCVQRREFTVLCGHDELAALVVGDVVAIEEFVHQAPAFHAEARLQRARRVMQAGVDHLGVARGDARPHAALALQNGHAMALARQRITARQAHRTCPHHNCVKVGTHGSSINHLYVPTGTPHTIRRCKRTRSASMSRELSLTGLRSTTRSWVACQPAGSVTTPLDMPCLKAKSPWSATAGSRRFAVPG